MDRIQVLLKPETIKKIKAAAKAKSISESAIIRQIVEFGIDAFIAKNV